MVNIQQIVNNTTNRIVYDIISLITIWGILNSRFMNNSTSVGFSIIGYDFYINYYPVYSLYIGIFSSGFLLRKYM
jgi:hypothetical protein